jgi:hypothetical protein
MCVTRKETQQNALPFPSAVYVCKRKSRREIPSGFFGK